MVDTVTSTPVQHWQPIPRDCNSMNKFMDVLIDGGFDDVGLTGSDFEMDTVAWHDDVLEFVGDTTANTNRTATETIAFFQFQNTGRPMIAVRISVSTMIVNLAVTTDATSSTLVKALAMSGATLLERTVPHGEVLKSATFKALVKSVVLSSESCTINRNTQMKFMLINNISLDINDDADLTQYAIAV